MFIFSDILALFVVVLGVMCVVTLIRLGMVMRYITHVHKDDNTSMGIVMDTKTGKVIRTFDYNRDGAQWRDIAAAYRDKLNANHQRKR